MFGEIKKGYLLEQHLVLLDDCSGYPFRCVSLMTFVLMDLIDGLLQ